MATYTAFTTLPGKPAASALGEALETLIPEPTGVGIFEIEDGSGLWEVAGYFLEEPDGIAMSLLAAVHNAKPFAVSKLPEKDWVAEVRRELAPIEAGRFYLYGSHDADKVPDTVVPLLIEAAMAFGTGHHGTTKGCLVAFDQLLNNGVQHGSVADIGCGTAVLAMAAAKVWDTEIYASDIDEVATDVATANAECNDLAGRMNIVTCAGFECDVLRDAAPFKIVFANILKGPLLMLASDIAQSCQKDGFTILSGILNTQADEVIAAYEVVDFSLENRLELGEWTTLTLKRLNVD